jgi:RNA polymerase sigma factor (sigma-70 family)
MLSKRGVSAFFDGTRASIKERRNAMIDCTTGRAKAAHHFYQAQAGDAASLNQLMYRHDGLVHYILRRQSSGPLSYGELLQAGRIGLWRAIMGYDPQRETAFSTYASVVIARHIWRAVRQAQQEGRRQQAKITPTLCPDPLGHLLEQEVQATLRVLVGQLPAKQRRVVCAYFGLDGRGGHTLAQLATQLGCTRQAVSYHLCRALLYLRHPAFSAALRALLGRNRRQDYLQALRSGRRRAT